MVRTLRWTTAVAVIFCLVGAQGNSILFASEGESQPSATAPLPSIAQPHLTFANAGLTNGAPLGYLSPGSRTVFDVAPADNNAFAAQIYRGRPYRRANNDGALAAIMIGAAATIAGAALLIYANRPDCNYDPRAGGCGYGMKVVGGSVLTGGAVGLMVGAMTWR